MGGSPSDPEGSSGRSFEETACQQLGVVSAEDVAWTKTHFNWKTCGWKSGYHAVVGVRFQGSCLKVSRAEVKGWGQGRGLRSGWSEPRGEQDRVWRFRLC